MSPKQLFGVKKVVANFLPSFLLCFFFLYRKWSRILFIKVLKSLSQLFGAKKFVFNLENDCVSYL